MKPVWPHKTLDELFTFKNGRAFKKEEWATAGVPIIRIQNLNDETAPFNYFAGEFNNDVLVTEGDLLFSWSGTVGSSFGAHRWRKGNGVLNQHIFKVGFRADVFHDYAFHALTHITAEVEKSVNGSVGLVHITKEKLGRFRIPAPPLAEQQRIVRILDEAFEHIALARANAEKNLQNAQAVFESYLQAIFTNRIASSISVRLSEACQRITVGHVGSMANEYRESGIPFLRSQNIRPFEICLDGVVFIDDGFHAALAKSQLGPGDLAIVRTGYPGTAAVIPPELTVANCSDLVIIRPGNRVDPHYLEAFFNSHYGKRLVLGKLVGAAQKHFNVTAAKAVALELPPIAQQRRVVADVARFRAMTQDLESVYNRKLAALDELKRSLLHDAFSGRL